MPSQKLLRLYRKYIRVNRDFNKIGEERKTLTQTLIDAMSNEDVVRIDKTDKRNGIVVVRPTTIKWDEDEVYKLIDNIPVKKLKQHGFTSRQDLRNYVFKSTVNNQAMDTLIQDKLITIKSASGIMKTEALKPYIRELK